jgi:hypothetical protein
MVGGKPTQRVRGKGRMIDWKGDGGLAVVNCSTAGDGSTQAACSILRRCDINEWGEM